MNPRITLMAAMTQNRVIGQTGEGIPWDLPRDRRHFREYCAGKFLLLGRKTYEEMTGWFTDQRPIVLTSQENLEVAENGYSTSSIERAIQWAGQNGANELVVCGGASIYELSLPFAHQLELTLIEARIDGDRHFPDYEAESDWETVSVRAFPADDENAYAMKFVTLFRNTVQ